MIRGGHKITKADGRFRAVRGREVSWRHLGKRIGALTHPLGRIGPGEPMRMESCALCILDLLGLHKKDLLIQDLEGV